MSFDWKNPAFLGGCAVLGFIAVIVVFYILDTPSSDPFKKGQSQTGNSEAMVTNVFGVLLLGIGLLGAAFFFLVFDVSVPSSSGGRIVNIGLMQDRQNGLMISLAVAIIGTILAVKK